MQNFMLTYARSKKLELKETSENGKKTLQKWETNSKRLIKNMYLQSYTKHTLLICFSFCPINVTSKTLLLGFVVFLYLLL